MTEALGWTCSFILLLTIGKQLHKQWHEDTSRGISKWLYLGQLTSAAGFTLYSWLVGNYVFVATNALLFIANLGGLALVLRHRRRCSR